MQDRFFRDAVDASASLLLWALHFFTVYIFVALACGSTLTQSRLFGRPLIKSVALLMSLIAALLALSLLWRAIALCRLAPRQLLSVARVGCTLLGILGIVWTSVPLVILSACMR